MKYHPLTEKIWNRQASGKDCVDSIIRTELEKMAKGLTTNPWGHQTYPQFVRETLGLSEVGEPDIHKDCTNPNCYHPAETPKSEKWCSHMVNATDDGNWNFCPICGTPRPVKKSLVHVVAEAIWLNNHPKTPFTEVDPISKTIWLSEAQAAIEAYRKYEGEKV